MSIRRPRLSGVVEVSIGELRRFAGRDVDDEEMRPAVERIALAVRLVLRFRDVPRPLLPAFSRAGVVGGRVEPHPRAECDPRPVGRPAPRASVARHRGEPTGLAAARRHHVELALAALPIREKGELSAVT